MLKTLTGAAALTLILTAPAFAGGGHSGHAMKSEDGAMAMKHDHGDMKMEDTALPILATSSTGLVVKDGYARAPLPSAKSGAAFLIVENPTDSPDRLIAASSDAAARVELHTHESDANGVMRMIHVEEGFDVPAGGMLMLERGGKHVMLMGLTGPLEEGADVSITLTFEKAGALDVTVPVDLKRGSAHGHGHSGS